MSNETKTLLGQSFLVKRLLCRYGGLDEEQIRKYVQYQEKKERQEEMQKKFKI